MRLPELRGWKVGTFKAKPVHLHWNAEQCTGCMSCVIVCSERRTGESAPSRSRITVLVDPLCADQIVHYCRQCRNAPCAAACPQEAIQFDDGLRAWLINEERCNGCGQCVEACPFEAMRLDPRTGLAIKCDLCRGAAWCTQVCPSGALTLKGRDREVDRGE